MSPSPGFGFPRARRLKRGSRFEQLKTEGKRLSIGTLTANWVELETEAVSQVGIITSRKLGHAAVRNRARRLLREAFRLHQHQIKKPIDLVLVARASIVGKSFSVVERDFMAAMRRADLLKASE